MRKLTVNQVEWNFSHILLPPIFLLRNMRVILIVCFAAISFACTNHSIKPTEQQEGLLARSSDAIANSNGMIAKSSNTQASYPAYNNNFVDWSFVGENLVWVLNLQGKILFSDNQGETWSTITQPINFDCLTFINERQGWGVGGDGQVWHTQDAGQTWELLTKLNSMPGVWEYQGFSQIIFKDESHGWIIDSFTVWRTINGGYTWQETFMSSTLRKPAEQPSEVFFYDSQNGWIVTTFERIFITKDGGQSWFVTVPAPGLSVGVFFVNARNGWIGGFDSTSESSDSMLYSTKDGGETWDKQSSVSPQIVILGVYFISENEGWILGSKSISQDKSSYVILHTQDWGLSWQRLPNAPKGEYFERIYFANSELGWLADSKRIYQTKDGGVSWKTALELPSSGDSSK